MECWADALKDCDGKSSREHYVSAGVFDKTMVTASGMKWCKGRKVEIGLSTAVAKILCRKHNSALSQYDAEAGKFSHFLLSEFRNNAEGEAHYIINGRMLEKWALKTAINLSVLGCFGDKGAIPTTEHLAILFGDAIPSQGMGLYVDVGAALDTRVARAGVHWVDIRNHETSDLVAVKLILNGLHFVSCLVSERADKKSIKNMKLEYRPRDLILEGQSPAGNKNITIDWN